MGRSRRSEGTFVLRKCHSVGKEGDLPSRGRIFEKRFNQKKKTV